MRDWSTRVALDGVRDRLRVQDSQCYTGEAVAELAAAKSRADDVLGLWGERASQPIGCEAPREYRRRLLKAVQSRSPRFKDKSPSTWGDALGIVEDLMYSDAAAAARDPNTVPAGQMRAVRERDAAGRLITRYIGNDYMAGYWDMFTQPGARCVLNLRGKQ
jgi:hypothetical protein